MTTGSISKIYIKRGASVAVKRFKMPPIKKDMKEKEYVELDEECQALYQLLSEGFSKEAKEKARGRLLAIWNGKKA